MKKTLAILLSLLMLVAMFSVYAGAADSSVETNDGVTVVGSCTCKDHYPATQGENICTCCVWCDNLNTKYLTSCATNHSTNGGFDGDLCCAECTGIYPCSCGCECCGLDYDESQDATKPILNEQQQEEVISAFQRFLNMFVEWFNNAFDAIFEFLRLNEILGIE